MSSITIAVRKYASRLFYIAVQGGFTVFNYVTASRYWSPKTYPDSFKALPSKPYLYASRIYLPAKNDCSAIRLPLVIQVHGGGFMINNPSADDPLARFLADNVGCVVANIDYRKAPQHVFPAGYEDVVAVSRALIDSQDHDIDRTRVILTGRSAGGNLVLAACQDKRLRSDLLGVHALYPCCDFRSLAKDKMASRPDPTVPDGLGKALDEVSRLYLGSMERVEQFENDVRLSPTCFSARADLPEHVYLVGADHDLLCAEAESMAQQLALGAERRVTSNGWEADGVKWDRVKDETHGFDIFGSRGKEFEEARLMHKEETYRAMADWMIKVFDVKR
ncbi:hypothetical protein LTR78_002113 [Recurvomyces mirabilis]|uniref:Alpha/beta hydrolase fold-3 domain-containing protein n=1 Tax=Recurvomyces mirabilis TaxID=574656 RepID=A0AAE1C4T9_9PEZI|nr:hypothetical protein LTR78_002113 [Recurvomyces mirabilis]KAK5160571.1 hypothetical protein LTS14_001583 [Recurvomyces mirabilis]